MNLDLKNLPDDPIILKRLLFEVSANHKKEFSNIKNKLTDTELKLSDTESKLSMIQKRLSAMEANDQWQKDLIAVLRYRIYGKKSERFKPEEYDQLLLFNEAERYASKQKEKTENISVKGYTRKKRGKRTLPDYLPEEITEHDLTEAEKQCPCCLPVRTRRQVVKKENV